MALLESQVDRTTPRGAAPRGRAVARTSARRTRPRRGARDRARQLSRLGEAARHQHDGNSGRTGAHARGVRSALPESRTAPRSHPSHQERAQDPGGDGPVGHPESFRSLERLSAPPELACRDEASSPRGSGGHTCRGSVAPDPCRATAPAERRARSPGLRLSGAARARWTATELPAHDGRAAGDLHGPGREPGDGAPARAPLGALPHRARGAAAVAEAARPR